MMVPIAPDTVPQRMEVALSPAAAARLVRVPDFIEAVADAELAMVI